jgi:hypothetical protein
MYELFTVNVNGTRFTFPTLPVGTERHAETVARRRAAILAKAAKVRTTRPRPRPFKGPKPGDGSFVPTHGAPGSTLTIDGLDYEVWSLAPGPLSVWATRGVDYYHVDMRYMTATQWAPAGIHWTA